MPELTLPVPVRTASRRSRDSLPGPAESSDTTETRARYVAADAALTALVLADACLDVVPGLCVRRGHRLEFLDPVRVRPVHGGRGPAWSVATSPGEFRTALARAFAVDTHAWVEELAEGRELEVPVVGLVDGSCLVGAPHDAGAGVFFARDRPVGGGSDFVAATGLSDLETARVRRVVQTAYRALELSGVACVSVVLDPPRVRVAALEAQPTLGPQSRVAAAFAAVGWSGPALRAAARGY